MSQKKQPDFDFSDNFIICFCMAIVGGGVGVVIGNLLGFDDIVGIFAAAGFFITIIIYAMIDIGSKPWFEGSDDAW